MPVTPPVQGVSMQKVLWHNGRRRKGFQCFLVAVLCFAAAGCGGTKLLKEAVPIESTQALATASDDSLAVSLDWVIVRDGPGSWARNADWDEYLLDIGNVSADPVEITGIAVFDSLDTELAPGFDRKELVKGSKRTARRYRKEGIRVRAGASASTMLVAGAAVTAIGVGGVHAAALGTFMSGSAASGLTAASGLVVLGPALAVGGIVRGVNNSKVNTEIEVRQSRLPLQVAPGETLRLHVFFPLAPSPQRIEIAYTNDFGDHLAIVNTETVLEGLHLEP